MFGGSQPGWSGSVRQILTDESNPHLREIFHPGANPTLLSSNQTATEMGSLRPDSPRSPTKHTVTMSLQLGRTVPRTPWAPSCASRPTRARRRSFCLPQRRLYSTPACPPSSRPPHRRHPTLSLPPPLSAASADQVHETLFQFDVFDRIFACYLR